MRRTAVQGNPGLEGGTLSLALGVSARVGTCLGQAQRDRVSGRNSELADDTLVSNRIRAVWLRRVFWQAGH